MVVSGVVDEMFGGGLEGRNDGGDDPLVFLFDRTSPPLLINPTRRAAPSFTVGPGSWKWSVLLSARDGAMI